MLPWLERCIGGGVGAKGSILAQSEPLEHFTTESKMAGMKIGTSVREFRVVENIEERDSITDV